MRLFYTSQELAGLPGMPGTDRRVRSWAEKNLAKSRNKLRGKGLEYHLLSLPTITQRYIAQHPDLFGSCAEFIQGHQNAQDLSLVLKAFAHHIEQ